MKYYKDESKKSYVNAAPVQMIDSANQQADEVKEDKQPNGPPPQQKPTPKPALVA